MDHVTFLAAWITVGVLVVMVLCTTIVVRQTRMVADKNYQALERIERALERVASATNAGGATGLRMEAHAGEVAEDLAASIQRADAANGPPGTAADSALSTAPRLYRAEGG